MLGRYLLDDGLRRITLVLHLHCALLPDHCESFVNDTVTVDTHKLAEILKSADGGCPVCVTSIADQMQALDPKHNWYELCDVEPYETES